jgi:GNAT superfamily N-acetyltransferase/RimJ/RimL family protein N-acetyltransferase
MEFERFAPASDTESVRACHEIYLSGLATDDPQGPPMSLRCLAGWLTLGWTEDPSETWLARDAAGQPCGWYVLSLPQRENRHLGRVTPMVHASRRRAGLGTALVRHVAARAHRLGRTLLESNAREDSPGSAFARRFGARLTITEVRSVLQVSPSDAGRLAALRGTAEKAARGYSLLSWDGPVPEEQHAAVAATQSSVADMPRPASQDEQLWDAERVRQSGHRVAAQGLRYYTAAARSVATGELAGLSQLGVDPAEPTWGHQELTVVARPHRGHRLGLLVKLAMLELLAEREPQLTRIITGNADGNKHMIAINAELGFRVLDRWPNWEIEVDQALPAGTRSSPGEIEIGP